MEYSGGSVEKISVFVFFSVFRVKKWKSVMDYQDLFWSELDRQDLLYGLCGRLFTQPPLRIRVTIIHYPEIDETKQFSDKRPSI